MRTLRKLWRSARDWWDTDPAFLVLFGLAVALNIVGLAVTAARGGEAATDDPLSQTLGTLALVVITGWTLWRVPTKDAHEALKRRVDEMERRLRDRDERTRPDTVQASHLAHANLPTGGATCAGGWRVLPLPMISSRMRVALVKPTGDEFAVVWADRWREALAIARAGIPIPEDCRALVPGEEDEP